MWILEDMVIRVFCLLWELVQFCFLYYCNFYSSFCSFFKVGMMIFFSYFVELLELFQFLEFGLFDMNVFMVIIL